MAKTKAELIPVDDPDAPALLEVESIEDSIPIAKIIELRNKELSYQEIASILGCSLQNIHQRLQPFRQSIEYLQAIKDNRADTLTVIGDSILTSLNHKDLQKASAYQKVGMAGLLHNMERLERDKSTANVAHVHKGITTKISDLEARIAENRALLGTMPEEGEDDA